MPGLVEELSEEINDVQAKLSSWAYKIVTLACDRKERHIHSMEQHKGGHFCQNVRTSLLLLAPPRPRQRTVSQMIK